MWLDWLVFCDCGFHSVCPLMEKDKRLMKLPEGETDCGGNFICLVSSCLSCKTQPSLTWDRVDDSLFCFISYHVVLSTLLSVWSPGLWGLPLRAKCMSSWSLHLYHFRDPGTYQIFNQTVLNTEWSKYGNLFKKHTEFLCKHKWGPAAPFCTGIREQK